MRTIIAGSRTITDQKVVDSACDNCGWRINTVVCGKARGVDTLGESYALRNGIPVTYYPAEWDRYGKSAGYKRNAQMAENAEALILIWDGKSKGSAMMLQIAERKGLRTHVVLV